MLGGVMSKRSESHEVYLIEKLKNKREAAAYLNAALEDGDTEVFLLALRDVVEANGGFSMISKKTQLNRQHLYKILSEDGNPELNSLEGILRSLGMTLTIRAKAAS
jgi:probable addiction module antidote protein